MTLIFTVFCECYGIVARAGTNGLMAVGKTRPRAGVITGWVRWGKKKVKLRTLYLTKSELHFCASRRSSEPELISADGLHFLPNQSSLPRVTRERLPLLSRNIFY